MKLTKRILTILLVLVLSIVPVACSGENIALTEEESDRLAEYMAYLYLKYDTNYTKKLITPTPTPTPRPTMEVTATPEPTLASENSEDETISGKEIKPSPTPIDPMEQANSDYAQILGLKNLDIEFVGYELRDSYNGNHYEMNSKDKASDPVSFSIEATDKNKQLLLISFKLKNNKNSKREIDLRKKEIKYQLDVNTGSISKPLLTLFDNDMQYLNLELESLQETMGVIVFEVQKDIDLNKAYLMITKNDRTAIIKVI